MSRRIWDLDHGPLRGFYRDRENAWIFGVCAGIAERFNFRLGVVRILALACFFLFSWLTLAIYVGATLLIRERPLIYSGRHAENEFWRRRGRDYWSHS
jgi:phage shock protein PspC (stress-responsive transcriptional regulator)